MKCPASGLPVRVKELITVNLDLVPEKDRKTSGDSSSGFYRCPLCLDVINNSTQTVLLKVSGKVICLTCFDKFVKADMKEPFSGVRLKKKEVIALQKGGTGFAANDVNKSVSKKFTPAFEC